MKVLPGLLHGCEHRIKLYLESDSMSGGITKLLTDMDLCAAFLLKTRTATRRGPVLTTYSTQAVPNCRNMYGPPPNCKKNRYRRETVAKMYPASEWRMVSGRMMMIRACLSLLIPTVVKDLVTSQVFRHAV